MHHSPYALPARTTLHETQHAYGVKPDQSIAHVGLLMARIRRSRGLTLRKVAQHLDVSPGTISKFEQSGRSQRARIAERYVELLASEHAGEKPLEPFQADLLRRILVNSNGRVDTIQAEIAGLSFREMRDPNAFPGMGELLARLRATRTPAFIADSLWFVHAANGATLNLFGIDPHSAFARRWEAWHVIASKFAPESPVRAVHDNPDTYFPPTVDFFFRTTAPYLFTPQMQALLRRLHAMSDATGLRFSEWWHSATTFNLHYDLRQLNRVVIHQRQPLYIAAGNLEAHPVRINPDYQIPFLFGEWKGLDETTRQRLLELPGKARPHELYFAADYDRNGDYHVNTWSEIRDQVAA